MTHLGVTVSPLFDEGGELHGAICLFSDLSAIKDLEEQLRLKESLAAVGELTAGIAHEFRNGLATIQGYSKLFDLQALPTTYRPYVEGIRDECESLNQMVTNFLNFARPAQLTLSRVDLGGVCEWAVVTGAFAWDDVGTWQALGRLRPKDPSGSVLVGPGMIHESHDCIVWSDGDPVVLFGVQDLVVVHANGRVLVMPTERAAAMKQLLDALRPEIRDIDG